MFALIWVTLLFTATGSVQNDNETCKGKTSALTLEQTKKTAAAGQCVVFECSFENNVTSFAWFQTDQSGICKEIFNSSKNTAADSEVGGRVSLLEPDLKKKNCSIIIKNLTTSDTGVYQVRAEAADRCTHVSKANITVEVQEINITLEIAPLKNKNITLTCSVPAFCSGSEPQFTWMFEDGKKKITENNTEFMINMMNATQSHTSNLTFSPSAKHHNMNFTCKVNFPGNTPVEKTLNMSIPPSISRSSCWNQSNLLTCVCISEGFPSPTITWPLLDSISEYSLSTNVSALSVTSNMTVLLEKFSNVTVECVSRNNIDETRKPLSISEANQTGNSNPSDQLNHHIIFSRLVELFKEKMISVLIVFGVGFLIGSLVTTLIACLTTKCHRNKKKNSHSTDELELVNAEAVFKDWDNEIPHVENNGAFDTTVQDNETLVFQDDGIQNQAAAGCEEELHGDLIDLDMSPKEAVYSDIDFSALKKKDPANAKKKEDTTETEYAEIKREEMEEAQENEGLDCKMLEGNDEMEVIIEHQEEAKQNVVVEEVIGEADPLYYDKNEVMDEN